MQFQYKRPMSETKRGIAFSINGDQVATLRMRDPTRTAFLTCPVALREDQIPGAINRTAFVDVHAIHANTSRLYIPTKQPIGNTGGKAKIKKGGYYPNPQAAIYDWNDILSGIQTQALGMIIRDGITTSSDFEAFMRRLAMLENLYTAAHTTSVGARYLTDGGKDEPMLNEEYATNLIDFAMEQRQELYIELEQPTDSLPEEAELLWDTIGAMADTRHPSIHKISRSSEYLMERGDSVPRVPLH